MHFPTALLTALTLVADAFKGVDHIRFASRVTAMGDDWIALERPLPYDLRTRWQVGCPLMLSDAHMCGCEQAMPMQQAFWWGRTAQWHALL